MPYCSECGIHYPEEETICHSCGHLLPEPENPSAVNAAAVPGPVAEGSLPQAVPSGAEPFNSRFQEESQLGKGLIKPFTIETEVDGVHFKYDKPPRSFSRAEVRKDITAEYRVTASDPEPQVSEDLVKPASPEWNEHWNEEYTGDTTVEPETESVWSDESGNEPPGEGLREGLGEDLTKEDEARSLNPPESGPAPDETDLSEQSGSVQTENTSNEADETAEEPSGLDMDLGFQTGEPELEPAEETEILWEGRRTLLGVPRSTCYRITNRMVQMNDYQSRKVVELELQLISGVELKQSWLAKLCGVGDLMIKVKDLPDQELCLIGIANPEKVLRLLEDLIRFKV